MVELQLPPPTCYVHPVYNLLRLGRMMGLGPTLDLKILKLGGWDSEICTLALEANFSGMFELLPWFIAHLPFRWLCEGIS